MAGDLAIQNSYSPPVAAAAAARTAPASSADNPQPAAQDQASKRPALNPSLHVDLALNLVVLQFVDGKGDVTASIPSEKQLKAYREHATQPEAQGGLFVKK